MEWSQLLSSVRIGQEVQYAPERHRPPWQYDHDRITFSSAFRRMQDKTQVFPLSSSDYIRTRLTHSMEASTVARSLGTWVGFELEKKGLLGDIHPLEVGVIVSAAALGHDIGNPPFGHSGEDAIRAWFLSTRSKNRFHQHLNALEMADFSSFEGNAQGFRILTRLQMYKDLGGMRLTAATLGAFVKYPIQSPTQPCVYKGVSSKKFGFFQSEASIFSQLSEILGLVRRETDAECWCRHPLAFLVEAADDICYRIVDLEDAFQQGLVDYPTVQELFGNVIGDTKLIDRARREPTKRDIVNVLRSLAIRRATEEACQAFLANHDAVLSGNFDAEIMAETSLAESFDAIKRVQKQNVYRDSRVLRVEAAGFRVIGGLLDSFTHAVFDVFEANDGKKTEPSRESAKLFDLLPDEFVGPGRVIASSAYERLLRITDYVCGMTDSYALDLYRNISGISLP